MYSGASLNGIARHTTMLDWFINCRGLQSVRCMEIWKWGINRRWLAVLQRLGSDKIEYRFSRLFFNSECEEALAKQGCGPQARVLSLDGVSHGPFHDQCAQQSGRGFPVHGGAAPDGVRHPFPALLRRVCTFAALCGCRQCSWLRTALREV